MAIDSTLRSSYLTNFIMHITTVGKQALRSWYWYNTVLIACYPSLTHQQGNEWILKCSTRFAEQGMRYDNFTQRAVSIALSILSKDLQRTSKHIFQLKLQSFHGDWRHTSKSCRKHLPSPRLQWWGNLQAQHAQQNEFPHHILAKCVCAWQKGHPWTRCFGVNFLFCYFYFLLPLASYSWGYGPLMR